MKEPEPDGTPAATLAGTRWLLVELAEETLEPLERLSGDERAPHLVLDVTGSVVGSGGCNRLHGRFELGDAVLRFGDIARTRMLCPKAVLERERRVLDALRSTRSYELASSTLVLRGDGDALARFAARDPYAA